MTNRGARLAVSLSVVPLVLAVLFAPTARAAGHSGAIHIYVSGTTVTTPILITGAITDYGKATSVTASGKPDENGNYERIVLKKGTFWVDATALNKKLNGVKPTIDTGHCFFAFKGSGPTTLTKGTGAYAGITGNINVTVNFVGIGPKLPNGKCNQKVPPLAQFGAVTGSGSVSY